MNNQEALNRAYAGLSAQGFQKSVLDDRCKYRGPDGRRCAVGHLIRDDEYREVFDQLFSGYYIYDIRNLCPSLHGVSLELLTALQFAHDGAHDPDDMRERLLGVAERFGLTPPDTGRGAYGAIEGLRAESDAQRTEDLSEWLSTGRAL